MQRVNASNCQADDRTTDAYIIFMSLLSLVVLMPAGNLAAVDAYFFGASSSTESGLNTYVAAADSPPPLNSSGTSD